MLKTATVGAATLAVYIATLITSTIVAVVPMTAALAKPITSNPYRAAYEKAIAHGAMSRPSKVQDYKEALRLAAAAIKSGDRHEAGKRAVQAVVIYSEANTPNSVSYVADSFAQTLGLDSLRKLPTFNAIMPPNVSGRGGNRIDEFGWFRDGDGTPTTTHNVPTTPIAQVQPKWRLISNGPFQIDMNSIRTVEQNVYQYRTRRLDVNSLRYYYGYERSDCINHVSTSVGRHDGWAGDKRMHESLWTEVNLNGTIPHTTMHKAVCKYVANMGKSGHTIPKLQSNWDLEPESYVRIDPN